MLIESLYGPTKEICRKRHHYYMKTFLFLFEQTGLHANFEVWNKVGKSEYSVLPKYPIVSYLLYFIFFEANEKYPLQGVVSYLLLCYVFDSSQSGHGHWTEHS
jgi:hypothetical protein